RRTKGRKMSRHRSFLLVGISYLWPLCLGSESFSPSCRAGDPAVTEVKVGSKAFTESVIVGELVPQLARRTGAMAEHREQLGGTAVLWNALKSGEIDVYPEYTGTISQELLAGRNLRKLEAIREALAEWGIVMSQPLGFNNTYEIGMKEEV